MVAHTWCKVEQRHLFAKPIPNGGGVVSTESKLVIIQRPHAYISETKGQTRKQCAAVDTWELPISPTEKQNVLSAPEHGCTKMSCEKAIWSDIHDEVIREQLRETFFLFCVSCLLPTDTRLKA